MLYKQQTCSSECFHVSENEKSKKVPCLRNVNKLYGVKLTTSNLRIQINIGICSILCNCAFSLACGINVEKI